MTDEIIRQDSLEILKGTADALVVPDYLAGFEILYVNPKTTIHDFLKIIEADSGLSKSILDAANSPFYVVHKKVANAVQAIQTIGAGEVLAIMRCRALLSLFGSVRTVMSERLISHGFAVGAAAMLIASHLRINAGADLFFKGLIHDIGKNLIALSMPEKFEKFLWVLNDPENLMEYHRLENSLIGISHSEAGALLLEKKGFSPDIRDAVMYHHSKIAQGADPLASSLIHIGDVLCNVTGHTPFKSLTFPIVEPGMLKPVFEKKKDFGTDDMMLLMNRLDIEIERLRPFYSALR
jgi:putative nucleotidyltransferase with HDIG domain